MSNCGVSVLIRLLLVSASDLFSVVYVNSPASEPNCKTCPVHFPAKPSKSRHYLTIEVSITTFHHLRLSALASGSTVCQIHKSPTFVLLIGVSIAQLGLPDCPVSVSVSAGLSHCGRLPASVWLLHVWC